MAQFFAVLRLKTLSSKEFGSLTLSFLCKFCDSSGSPSSQLVSRGRVGNLSYFIVQYAEKIREWVTTASETPHLLSIFATAISLPLAFSWAVLQNS